MEFSELDVVLEIRRAQNLGHYSELTEGEITADGILCTCLTGFAEAFTSPTHPLMHAIRNIYESPPTRGEAP